MKLGHVHPYAWAVAAAAVALWWLTRQGQAQAAGAAVGAAVVNGGAGLVLGAGDAVGIPRTNPDRCAAALAAGDMWAASFACPAGDFIGAVFGGSPPSKPAYTGGASGGW